MYSNLDILWILVCSFLVFLMQLGFALIETGAVRSKNTINVAMKNLIDSVFGIIFFWIIGFGLMFGTDYHGLLGISEFFISGEDFYQNTFFFFQAMFAATAVTIVSGAVAERIKFNGYIVVAIVLTSVIYPIYGHWAWSDDGWLHKLGFMDFAGSTVVHSIGAWVGLAGALIIGPRIGKFRKGRGEHFAPSNHNFIVFGIFILFFAWFGFNGGSLLKFDAHVSSVLLNTLLAGMTGGVGGWFMSLIYNSKKIGVELFGFGVIAGLVGITAGCNQLDTTTSAFIGFSSSVMMFYTNNLLLYKYKIDDPLSAISVHGFAGAWGTLCVGFFAALPEGMSRIELVLVQLLGVVVAFGFAFSLGILLFFLLGQANLLRVSKKHEIMGLNICEHNAKQPWVDTIESIIKIMRTGNIHQKIYEERYTEVGLVAKFFNYLLTMLRKNEVTLKKNNVILKKQAILDPLTKILNRGGLFEKIESLNFYQSGLSVVMLDIDSFKLVNDTHGHHVGDMILEELSRVITNTIRTNDIFARWGGEEFVIIVKTGVLSEVEAMAEKIRVKVKKHEFPIVKNITISLGVTSAENEEEDFQKLFEKADKALYQAKDLGRDRVCTW